MSRKITLLYAEDEVATRLSHVEYLKDRYDFEYLEASDGEEAFELFKKHQPEIILTDINMPKMDGLTFVKKVRTLSPYTKVVMLTAYEEQEMLMTALGLDVVNYLLKPINRRKLSTVIDLILETLPNTSESKNIYRLDENTRWDDGRMTLYRFGDEVSLTQSEKRLLSLLCAYRDTDVSSEDIFIHVWQDFDTEFNTDSVRTLVKKLRKQLPEGIITNTYGGLYRLQ